MMKRMIALFTALALLSACTSNPSTGTSAAESSTTAASAATQMAAAEATTEAVVTAEATAATEAVSETPAATETTAQDNAPASPAADGGASFQDEVIGLKYTVPAGWTPVPDNLDYIKMYDAGTGSLSISYDEDSAGLSIDEMVAIHKEVFEYNHYAAGEEKPASFAGLDGFRIPFSGTTSLRGDFTAEYVVLLAENGTYTIGIMNYVEDNAIFGTFESFLAGMTR